MYIMVFSEHCLLFGSQQTKKKKQNEIIQVLCLPAKTLINVYICRTYDRPLFAEAKGDSVDV